MDKMQLVSVKMKIEMFDRKKFQTKKSFTFGF